MNTIYTGASGLMTNMQKVNVHSNNIANIDTNGYKRDQESFKVFMETNQVRTNEAGKENIGAYQEKVYVDDVRTKFDPGALKTTGRELDFLINDGGNAEEASFFVVGNEEERYLTRNGNFHTDEEGQLHTASNDLVRDEEDQPIVIDDGVSFSVGSNGDIRNNDTDELIGRMQLVTVAEEDLGLLEKKSGAKFEVMDAERVQAEFGDIDQLIAEFNQNPTLQARFGSVERLEQIAETGEVEILQAFNGEVQAGMLESSNVDMGDEMAALIMGQRGVQVGQQVISKAQDIFDKQANHIGR